MPSLINVVTPINPAGMSVPVGQTVVLATLGGINTDGRESIVVIEAILTASLGAGATAATLELVRGASVNGAFVAETGPLTVVGGDVVQLHVVGFDTPGDVVDAEYSVTLAVTGATAVTSINTLIMRAQVQTPD